MRRHASNGMKTGDTARGEGIASRSFKAAALLVAVLFGLLPALYLPLSSIPFELGKTYVLFIAVLLAGTLFLIGSLLARRIALPKNALLPIVFLLPLVYFFSALFSFRTGLSLIDPVLSIDTAATMFALALLALLGSALFASRGSVLTFGFWALIGAVLVAIVALIQLTVGLPLETFAVRTANLVGKWNDLGIYFGLICIIALYVLSFTPLPVRSKRILWCVLGISLLFVAAVNFFEVWAALAVASALFLWLSAREAALATAPLSRSFFARMPLAASLTLIISLVFVLFHGYLSVVVGNAISVYQIEARPSWGSTLAIAQATYADDPLLGSGPNTFAEQWRLFKPAGVNETPFWGSNFTQGVGVAPTSLVTEGILGGLAWVVLLGALLFFGVKLFRSKRFGSDSLTVMAFIAALYLFAMLVLYLPDITLAALAFLALGIFIAQFERERKAGFWALPVSRARIGLAGSALVAVLIVGFLFVAYAATTRMASGVEESRARIAIAAGDLPAALSRSQSAARIQANDRTARLAAEVGFLVLRKIATASEGSNADRVKQFETAATAAVNAGFSAVNANPRNHENWVTLGRLYEFMFSLGVEGAYNDAKIAYERASARSPHDPSIFLILARLEAGKGDSAAARSNIARALGEKNNYTAAVFFLSQLEIAEGKIAEAISSTEIAVALAPRDPVVWFQLGFLRYSQGQYEKAAEALEQAVILREDYSNARYFLGLSYHVQGRVGDAIAQFERIAELNPGNAEIALILGNIRAGKKPFSGTKPPVSTPEKRADLPLSE